MRLDYSPIKKCKHPEWTYREICVRCGECGRYNKQFTCVNCGFISRNRPIQKLKDWGEIEFYDGWYHICPKCKPLFKEEDQTIRAFWECRIISCYRKDFIQRREAI